MNTTKYVRDNGVNLLFMASMYCKVGWKLCLCYSPKYRSRFLYKDTLLAVFKKNPIVEKKDGYRIGIFPQWDFSYQRVAYLGLNLWGRMTHICVCIGAGLLDI